MNRRDTIWQDGRTKPALHDTAEACQAYVVPAGPYPTSTGHLLPNRPRHYGDSPNHSRFRRPQPRTAESSVLPAMAAAPAVVPHRNLGSQRLEVSAQGLGCMGMSTFYGPPRPEAPSPHMVALIHHAVTAGVTFLDTSDTFLDTSYTNEILLGKVGEPKKLVEEGKIKYIGLSGGLMQFSCSGHYGLETWKKT